MHIIKRGVMIPWFKKEASGRKIEPLRRAGTVWLPLPEAMDEAARQAVAIPRPVQAGDVLWEDPDGMPLYATVTGDVIDVSPVATPDGTVLCLRIRYAARAWEKPESALLPAAAEDVAMAARRAAIVDELDGVPLWEKLTALREQPYAAVVADGVEPEPYACSAYAVLKTQGKEVLAGLQLAAQYAGIGTCRIAVQLKRRQQEALEKALGADNIYGVPNRYPVPRYLPGTQEGDVARIGVQACRALYRAVTRGEPALSAVVTVTGDALRHSRNLRVPYGATLDALLTHVGREDDPCYLIVGDALTGIAVEHDALPVTPGVTCLIGMIDRIAPVNHTCIGCGRCVTACHQHLLPYEIARRLENMHYDRLASLHPERCDGCGTCGYVCPAGKNLTARVLEAKDASSSVIMNWGESHDL